MQAPENRDRKRRMELEAKVKDLEGMLEDREELQKALEKEKRRAEKLKTTAAEWQVRRPQSQVLQIIDPHP